MADSQQDIFNIPENNDGNSLIYSIFEDLLQKGLQTDINMNNHKITGLITDENDLTSAANVEYVQDTFVSQGNVGQLASLNTINSALPLTGNLNFTGSNFRVLVKDQDNLDTSSNQVINKNDLINERIAQRAITNTSINNLSLDSINRNQPLQQDLDFTQSNEKVRVKSKVDLNTVSTEVVNLQDLINKNLQTLNASQQYVDNQIESLSLNSIHENNPESLFFVISGRNDLTMSIPNIWDSNGTINPIPVFQLDSRFSNLGVNWGQLFQQLIQERLWNYEYVTDALLSYFTKDQINTILADYDNKTQTLAKFYTKTEIDGKFISYNFSQQGYTDAKVLQADNALRAYILNEYLITPQFQNGIYQAIYDVPTEIAGVLQVKDDQNDQLVSPAVNTLRLLETENSLQTNIDTTLADAQNYTDNTLNTRLATYYDRTAVDQIKDDLETQINDIPSNYYTDTTPLDQITLAAGSLNLNNQKIINLQTPSDPSDAVNKSYADSLVAGVNSDRIQNSTQKSQIVCALDNRINIKSNDVTIGKIYQAIGQTGVTPMVIEATDKLQLVTAVGSSSIYSTKTLQAQPALNVNTFGINSQDDITKNVINQFQIGGSQGQLLTLSSGHLEYPGLGMQQYSAISNSADGLQQSILISAGNPETDNTIRLYSDSFATTIVQPCSIQFTKKTGYSSASQVVDQNNQFTSKKYVDDSITTNNSSFYTKTQSDDNYYSKTTPLNSITVPSADLSLNSKKITSLASGSNPSDAINKGQLDTAVTGLISQTTGDGRYYLNTTALNSITPPTLNVSLNSKKITSLANGTDSSDAVNKGQLDTAVSGLITQSTADTRYIQQNTTLDNIAQPLGNMNFGGYQLKNVANGTQPGDIMPKSQTETAISNAVTGLASISYTDTQLATKLNQTTADSRYYLNTVPLNNITLPSGNLLMNSKQIKGVLDPTDNQDVATKYYVDQNSSQGVVNPSFYVEWSPTNNSQTYTVTHNLGYAITDLDILIGWRVKNTELGYNSGDIIYQDGENYNGNLSGTGYGYCLISSSLNAFIISCGSGGINLVSKTGGNKNPFNYNQVVALISVMLRTSPKVLQANSINSSNIVPNANLDLSSNKFLTSATTFTGNEIPNVTWIQNNTSVGTPSKIQNGTNTTVGLTANSTELTNGTSILNMNGYKITGLPTTTPSQQSDAVSYGFLIVYRQGEIVVNGLRSICQSNGIYRVYKDGRSDYFTASTIDDSIAMSADSFLFSTMSTAQSLFGLDVNKTQSYRRMKISSSSTATTSALTIDQSCCATTSDSLLKLTTINSGQKCIEISGNGQLISDGLITTTNQLQCIAGNGLMCIALNNETQISVSGASSTTISDVKTALIQSHSNQGGVYGFYSQNWITASNFEIYVPASSQYYKRDITDCEIEGFEEFNFKRFYYDQQKCEEKDICADFSQQNFGCIIEELPLPIKDRYAYDKGNGVWTVDISQLKDDILQFHQVKIRDQQSRIQELETIVQLQQNQLITLSQKMEQLLQILNISL